MEIKEKYNINTNSIRLDRKKLYLNGKQNGITIISLIITIIVILILGTVAVTVGTGSIENSQLIAFVSYMQVIQGKVDFIAEHEDFSNYGEALTTNQLNTLSSILNNQNESYITTIDSSYLRYFDKNLLASDLDVENIYDEVVIDFNTREVISLRGISYENNMYYTQYYLPGGQKLKQQTDLLDRNNKLNFGQIEAQVNGLNATIIVNNIGLTNGTLSYGRMDDSNTIRWTTLTNYTKSGENVTTPNITESGTYYFKLVDNITGKDNIDNKGNYPSLVLRLTNSPKLENDLTNLSTTYNYSNLNTTENWAVATDITGLSYYVWIPRYAYKLNSAGNLEDLEFLRGTSDVTSSGGYINNTDWIVPETFTNVNGQKTGVWVKVNSLKQTR